MRGFEQPNRINLGNLELKGDIDQNLEYTSLTNQEKVRKWLKTEINVVTENFQRGKQELIWGRGRRESFRAIAKIENDLGRLDFSLKRTKGSKLRFLLEDKGQGRREEARGRAHQERDTEALINECRKQRHWKRKKRLIDKERK